MEQTISIDENATLTQGLTRGLAALFFLPANHQFELEQAAESLPSLFDTVERAKQEWEATADALSELICLVDDRSRILRANRTIEKWGLGQVTTASGLALHDLLHPNCSGLFCSIKQFLEQMGERTVADQTSTLETYDPVMNRCLSISMRPVSASKKMVSGAVVVVQDIT